MAFHDAVFPPLPPLDHRRLSTLLEQQVEQRPTAAFAEFLVDQTSWTYAEFFEAAQRIAGGLRLRGLEPGDRVGIMLPNRSEYALTWLGSVVAGTIDVAINNGLSGQRLAHQLSLSGVKVVVGDAASLSAVAAVVKAVPTLETFVLVGPHGDVDPPPSLPVERFDLLFGDPQTPYASAPSDTVSIRYTSGTTGPAKAVAMTHSRLTTIAAHFVWLMGYQTDDIVYTCFPLHHGIASSFGIVSTLLAGGKVVVDERFSASNYWPRIREHGATLAHIINPLVPILMAQPETSADRDHRCTRLWTAVPSEAFENRFGAKLVYFYGQSEGNAIAYTPPGETAPPGSSGRPSPRFEVMIADADDYPVSAGTDGQILWRPKEPHLMMPEYYGDPAATVAAWRNLWFHSGDLGRLDEDGYLYLLGRMGDQIRRKGVNIAAEDVEAAAREFDEIVEAAAIAVPSELTESEVKLCIVPRSEAFELSTFYDHLRRALPAEMVPRYVEVRDSLPRTDTHKIAKAVLRTEGDRGMTATTVDLEPMRRRPATTGSADRSAR
jgi:crotonobetaine/carnitine-CoA ligase